MTQEPTFDELDPQTQDLVLQFDDLAQSIVDQILRRLPRSVQRDDLLSAARSSVMTAVRKHDTTEATFPAYLKIRIRGAVIDELRSQDWMSRRKRTPEDQDRAKTVHVGRESLLEAAITHASQGGESIDALLANRDLVDQALDSLSERAREVVILHYFEGLSFREIAALVELSEPRISQIHTKAIEVLRNVLTEMDPPPP